MKHLELDNTKKILSESKRFFLKQINGMPADVDSILD
jgi:hypothetical protein